MVNAQIATTNASVVIVTNHQVQFRTTNWKEKLVNFVEKHPTSIVCPAVLPTGNCSCKGLAYGGHLDVLETRGGHPVILEPRWNLEIPEKGVVQCIMGGTYAFHEDWYRSIGGFEGMKDCGIMQLVAISLRTRLAGGSCVVLQDVVAEQSFGGHLVNQSTVAYNKIRLAMSSLPLGISTKIPTLLAGTPGLEKAMKDIMADIKSIQNDRDRLEAVCGGNLAEAASKAAITFKPFQATEFE